MILASTVMFVALLQFELLIRGAENLKDKRRVVRSLKDRLHHDHMVSVAEVGALDEHRRAEMALSLVSTDVAYAAGVLDRIVERLREHREAELGRCTRHIVHRDDLPESELDDEGRPEWSDADTGDMLKGIDRVEREIDGGAA
ncbi:MAG: DUF503 domain-containing protein [Planctomycetes bacterium]|nr:DUF503 domain-containing protein [Planctomycetota bacterium]